MSTQPYQPPALNADAYAALVFMLERHPTPLRQVQLCNGLPQIGLNSSAALQAFLLLQSHRLVRLRRSGRTILETLARGGPELESLRRSAAAQLEREHRTERKRGLGR